MPPTASSKAGGAPKVEAKIGDDGMVSIGVKIEGVFIPLASSEGAYVKSRIEALKSPEAGGASADDEDGEAE